MTTDDAKSIAWLNPKSKAFAALQSIVMDKFVLKAMKKMTKFCHTGDLEVFHNTLLKFCPKRQHFPYEGMSARLMLAAYDWNHMEMVQKKDRSGNPATAVVYSKRRKLYVLRNTCTRVKTDHMLTLMQRIFEVFRDQILLRPIEKPAGQQRIAKIPKPTKSELAKKFKSRFH